MSVLESGTVRGVLLTFHRCWLPFISTITLILWSGDVDHVAIEPAPLTRTLPPPAPEPIGTLGAVQLRLCCAVPELVENGARRQSIVAAVLAVVPVLEKSTIKFLEEVVIFIPLITTLALMVKDETEYLLVPSGQPGHVLPVCETPGIE